MKLVKGMKCLSLYFVLSGLLRSSLTTEVSGQPDEHPAFYCEKYARVIQSGRPEENNSRSSGEDRSDAYVIKARKWPRNNLTYTIARYSNQFSRETLDEVFRKVVQKWSDVSALTFRAVSNTRADINVEFVYQLEGDRVALSFYPEDYNHTIRFRETVSWTIDRYGSSTNLNLIALHEWGHTLGICHSNVRTAIMYGTYLQPKSADVQLDEDDILAVQRLYGPNPRTGYRPKYDPGPSTDTVGNEAYWSSELGCHVSYIKKMGKWVLHRYDNRAWVPLPPHAPRPRNLPEPPPEGSNTGGRNYDPQNRRPPPPIDRRPAPPTDRRPAPPTDRRPAPPTDRRPAPPTDRRPAPPTDRRPAPPTNRRHPPPINRRKDSSSSSEEFTSEETSTSSSSTSSSSTTSSSSSTSSSSTSSSKTSSEESSSGSEETTSEESSSE